MKSPGAEQTGTGLFKKLLLELKPAGFKLLPVAVSPFLTAPVVILQCALLAEIAGNLLSAHSLNQIQKPLLYLAVLLCLRFLITWFSETSAAGISETVKNHLRIKLLRIRLLTSASTTCASDAGNISMQVMEGVESLDGWYSQYFPRLLQAAIVPLCIAGAAFSVDILTGFIFLFTAPMIPFFMRLIGEDAGRSAEKRFSSLNRLGGRFADGIAGLFDLKIGGSENIWAEHLRLAGEKLRKLTLETLKRALLSSLALEWIATLATALIAVICAVRLMNSQMEFTTALFVILLAPEFYLPLRSLAQSFHGSLTAAGASKKIFPIIENFIDPVTEITASMLKHAPPISIENLQHSWGENQPPLFDQLSLNLKAGSITALTGESGCGKTTLANILAGLIKIDSGNIYIDYKNISEIPAEQYHYNLCYLLQAPFIFSGSLLDNLLEAKPDAQPGEIMSALHDACLDEYIPDLQKNTVKQTGDGGLKLSGGQLRRLALARVFLKDSPIWILDEPTAGLDAELEKQIENNLRRRCRNKTVLIISHRKSLLQMADTCLRIDKGRVVEIEPGQIKTDVLESDLLTQPVLIAAAACAIEQPPSKNLFSLLKYILSQEGSLKILLISAAAGCAVLLSGSALTSLSVWLLSSAASGIALAALSTAIVGVRFFGIFRGLMRWSERVAVHSLTLLISTRMRLAMFTALARSPLSVIRQFGRGDLLARISSDLETTEGFAVRLASPLFSSISAALIISWYLFFIDSRIFILFACLITAAILMPFLLNLFSAKASGRIISLRSDVHQQILETLNAATELKLLSGFKRRIDRISSFAEILKNLRIITAAFISAAGSFAVMTSSISILIFLIWIMPEDFSSIPEYLAVLFLIPSAFEAAIFASSGAASLYSIRSAWSRIYELLVKEKSATSSDRTNSSYTVFHSIELISVNFTYPQQNHPSLQNINLKLTPAKHIALSGASGSGKSTLLNILSTIEPAEGLLLNGKNIMNIGCIQMPLWAAYVTQTIHWFDVSLRENLLLGAAGADDAQMAAVLEECGLYKFVRQLDDTAGLKLSGGELRRFAVARALLRKPSLWLFDEPAEHLDAASEDAMIDLIERITAQSAMVYASHRFHKNLKFDEVIELKNGTVISHEIIQNKI